jgi:hypothetical protein
MVLRRRVGQPWRAAQIIVEVVAMQRQNDRVGDANRVEPFGKSIAEIDVRASAGPGAINKGLEALSRWCKTVKGQMSPSGRLCCKTLCCAANAR